MFYSRRSRLTIFSGLRFMVVTYCHMTFGAILRLACSSLLARSVPARGLIPSCPQAQRFVGMRNVGTQSPTRVLRNTFECMGWKKISRSSRAFIGFMVHAFRQSSRRTFARSSRISQLIMRLSLGGRLRTRKGRLPDVMTLSIQQPLPRGTLASCRIRKRVPSLLSWQGLL